MQTSFLAIPKFTLQQHVMAPHIAQGVSVAASAWMSQRFFKAGSHTGCVPVPPASGTIGEASTTMGEPVSGGGGAPVSLGALPASRGGGVVLLVAVGFCVASEPTTAPSSSGAFAHAATIEPKVNAEIIHERMTSCISRAVVSRKRYRCEKKLRAALGVQRPIPV
jgi:hypothetical protein